MTQRSDIADEIVRKVQLAELMKTAMHLLPEATNILDEVFTQVDVLNREEGSKRHVFDRLDIVVVCLDELYAE